MRGVSMHSFVRHKLQLIIIQAGDNPPKTIQPSLCNLPGFNRSENRASGLLLVLAIAEFTGSKNGLKLAKTLLYLFLLICHSPNSRIPGESMRLPPLVR